MARSKKQAHKVVMTEGKRQIIAGLLSEYDIKSAKPDCRRGNINIFS